MAEPNIMDNIISIEMGQMFMDDVKPTSCIIIQTKRNRYCFRLSESFPVDRQYKIFKQFVSDINEPVPNPTLTEVMENTMKEQEKKDSAPVSDTQNNTEQK